MERSLHLVYSWDGSEGRKGPKVWLGLDYERPWMLHSITRQLFSSLHMRITWRAVTSPDAQATPLVNWSHSLGGAGGGGGRHQYIWEQVMPCAAKLRTTALQEPVPAQPVCIGHAFQCGLSLSFLNALFISIWYSKSELLKGFYATEAMWWALEWSPPLHRGLWGAGRWSLPFVLLPASVKADPWDAAARPFHPQPRPWGSWTR